MSSETDWKPGDPLHERPDVDPELSAMEDIVAAFGALDHNAQGRVLRWAHDRYAPQHPDPARPEE